MKQNGPLAVVGAAALWGTSGTAGVLAIDSQVSLVSLTAARLVIGGAVLALAAGTAILRVPSRGLILLATLAVVGFQLAFFASITRTGVAIGTVVAIGSGPVFTGLLTWLFDGTRPTPRWTAATATAIAGCVALVVGGGTQTGSQAGTQAGSQVTAGIALALLAGLLYALYAVIASRVIRTGVPSGAVMGAMFGGSALIMLPILLLTDTAWLATPGGLIAAVYLGCATTALSYFLYGRGLRTTPVTVAATLALAEPAVATLLGVLVLGERLVVTSLAGLVLLGASLVVVALPGGAVRRQAAESSV
ncbi:EamA family transporter [Streptosporangium soli]|nr:EamA family transporter [Streptosporangium sp. KLBMP 9127]